MSKRQLKWKELLNLCNEYQTFLNNRAVLVYKSKSGDDYNKNLSSLYNSLILMTSLLQSLKFNNNQPKIPLILLELMIFN